MVEWIVVVNETWLYWNTEQNSTINERIDGLSTGDFSDEDFVNSTYVINANSSMVDYVDREALNNVSFEGHNLSLVDYIVVVNGTWLYWNTEQNSTINERIDGLSTGDFSDEDFANITFVVDSVNNNITRLNETRNEALFNGSLVTDILHGGANISYDPSTGEIIVNGTLTVSATISGLEDLDIVNTSMLDTAFQTNYTFWKNNNDSLADVYLTNNTDSNFGLMNTSNISTSFVYFNNSGKYMDTNSTCIRIVSSTSEMHIC
jgi:hypothetical protein